MEKELYLCKCVLCVSKNENGTFVSKPIYTRHRKRAQILSSQDDENIDQVEVHDQDFHENIIENIDDIEDFDDFDNLEIISDNEEGDDDNDIASQDDEEEDNDDNDIDEDDDDNSEDSDNAMQIEDHNIISKEIIDGLKLLYVKSLHNFTEAANKDIKIFAKNNLSLYKVKNH